MIPCRASNVKEMPILHVFFYPREVDVPYSYVHISCHYNCHLSRYVEKANGSFQSFVNVNVDVLVILVM